MDRQPTRSKRIREERRFDKTQLKMEGHGRTVHRDMAAHALRWRYITQVVTDQALLSYGPWIAGLVDGEGCFGLNVRDDDRRYVQFTFALGLREDDEETLQLVQRILGGIGSITLSQNQRITNAKPLAIWGVSRKQEIAQLVEFFRAVPLRSKKSKDFEIWAEAFDKYYAVRAEANNGTPFPQDLFDEMVSYSNLLQHSRRYETWEHWKDLELAILTSPDGPAMKYLRDVEHKYGWVHRHVKQGLSILDIGCGQNMNLLYCLGARIQTVPDLYVGVDLNSIPKKGNVRWADIYDNFDFVTNGKKLIDDKYTPFDMAVCFEVVEHMMPEDAVKLLENVFYALRPGGMFFLSTPVFNGSAAANHIHEQTIPELRGYLESVGFVITKRFGTFASKPEIKNAMRVAGDSSGLKVYDELEDWFGGEVMATVMAPLYPDASRNVMWICKKPE